MESQDLVNIFTRMIEVSGKASTHNWTTCPADPTSAESQTVYCYMVVGLPNQPNVDEMSYDVPDSQLLKITVESIWGHHIVVYDAVTNDVMTVGYWDCGWHERAPQLHEVEYVLSRIIFEAEFKSEMEAQRLRKEWLEIEYERQLESDSINGFGPDACPGCGCEPGDGRTEGCNHPEGCGYMDEGI